jgi:hypothetical protein
LPYAEKTTTDYPQITIRDPSLPVINVGDGQNPSYLPPDVCIVLPGQPSRSKLTPFQTQQMIRFAVRKPHLNAQSIATSGAQMLGFDPTNPTLVCVLLFLIKLLEILTLQELIWHQRRTKAHYCSWTCSQWPRREIQRQQDCFHQVWELEYEQR